MTFFREKNQNDKVSAVDAGIGGECETDQGRNGNKDVIEATGDENRHTDSKLLHQTSQRRLIHTAFQKRTLKVSIQIKYDEIIQIVGKLNN